MAWRRGAVVIGVNKTGGLAALESPATGAGDFAQWLGGEGFEVKTITDQNGPVKAVHIKDAIKAFVDPGTYDQLVIYFSGHGYWKNNAELWLLSDAPDDADAAVSWVETAEYARDCGIPNVVMISDACRSIPDTVRAQRVRGSVVFPNLPVQRGPATKIDKFLAAVHGAPAYEIPIGPGGVKTSVFTHCFRAAFESPDRDMVRAITEGGETFDVVPNRKLEGYLRREVSDRLAAVNIQYDQLPVADVLSDDDVYIGRVRRPDRVLRGSGEVKPPPIHVREVAALTVAEALRRVSRDQLGTARIVAEQSGFNQVLGAMEWHGGVTHFESHTGFTVNGASVLDAVGTAGARVELLQQGQGGEPAIVRVWLQGQPACSVALRFSNGQGTVLAALEGYIGHISAGEDRVRNVSYIPSDNTYRWNDYAQRREQVEKLRAAVAAAAQFDAFRIDKERAAAFADEIRVAKSLDPTLGVYAAYAYAEAGLRREVRSVRSYMHEDLSTDLFDVAMLDRDMPPRVAPFCPMLTQGWNLLRVRGIKLPKILEDAQDELVPALWTTFASGRTDLIFQAMQTGELK